MIVLLYKNKYYDFTFKHFHEWLVKKEGIKVSYKLVYNVLTYHGIISPKARKDTKKAYVKQTLIRQKKINLKMSNVQIKNIVKQEMIKQNFHPRIAKPNYFGEIIELDGTNYYWFDNKKTCLHLAIDKASSTIVGAWFDTKESLNGYYQVLFQILNNYGIPKSITTDKHCFFSYLNNKPDKRTSEKDVLTQFDYACKQLGIVLKTTSIAQNKGLIERSNETFKNRLQQELRINNIYSLEKANDYLLNEFVPSFNVLFALDYKLFESVFLKAPSKEHINYILSVLMPRKLDDGNAIKFHNEYYQPHINDKLSLFLPNSECLLIKTFDDSLFATHNNQIYELKKLSRNKQTDDSKPNTTKQSSTLKKMVCPWTLDYFKLQVKRFHSSL